MISYAPENMLPNFRSAGKCCNTCENFTGGYEGDGECKIMTDIYEKKWNPDEGVFVIATVSGTDLCDKWKKKVV